MSQRVDSLQLGEIELEVRWKDIKNVHLSVHPPEGRVTLVAPLRMELPTIRVFAIAKLTWIKQQRRKMLEQVRQSEREYLTRESHYIWGKRLLLRVVEKDAPPQVQLRPSQLLLQVRPGSDEAKRKELMEAWYRDELRRIATAQMAHWMPIIGVQVDKLHIQHMKTKWGSCNPAGRAIRLNTELAKKPRECLEYILVHELVHLLEPSHNQRFLSLMDQFLPSWREHRDLLNRLPVCHEEWGY